ncbi:MAG TPA: peptidoglycan-associated lipoprotein Pal [Holophagaceae bacterium]|nr:peptidoglycan-associated lipoprotein Pal [Holophagaceae bacterium]
MRATKSLAISATLAMMLGVACSKPAPAPEPPKPVEQPKTDDDAAKRAAEEAEAARRKAEEEARKKREAEEARLRAAHDEYNAAKSALKNIHFDFDKSDIKENDRATLQGIADFMKKFADVKIQIAGHCDERGTNEYNLALGNRRTASALAYLKSLGVDEARISTISYGKERPLCTESNEACWSQNRRDEFSVSMEHEIK